MYISIALLNLVKDFEGFRSQPYLCPANKWTIGYGITIYNNGAKVTSSDNPITEEEATRYLAERLRDIKVTLNYTSKKVLHDEQLEAFTSFAYNLGIAYCVKSTVWKKCLKGEKITIYDFIQHCKYWKNGLLIVSEGLRRRRQKEYNLFVS